MDKPKLILVDANVLLEISLDRLKRPDAAAFFENNKHYKMCISPLTVHIYLYFMKLNKQNIAEALIFLDKYFVLPLDDVSTKWALNNCPDGDYEDALQVACAVFSDCAKLVTFDQQLFKNYSRHIDIELLG